MNLFCRQKSNLHFVLHLSLHKFQRQSSKFANTYNNHKILQDCHLFCTSVINYFFFIWVIASGLEYKLFKFKFTNHCKKWSYRYSVIAGMFFWYVKHFTLSQFTFYPLIFFSLFKKIALESSIKSIKLW